MPDIFMNAGADGAVQVDSYILDYPFRPSCNFCSNRAWYQARHPDLYDGDWQQACVDHLADAINSIQILISTKRALHGTSKGANA